MEGFPVRVRVDVRFRDLDPLGHVNNAVFLSYMELARIRYFQRISPDWLGEGHFVVAIGRSSLRMEHLVTANGESAAKGLGVLVWLEGGRPAPLPEAIRERIRALEGRPL